jgi:alpha,alpha-trehalase
MIANAYRQAFRYQAISRGSLFRRGSSTLLLLILVGCATQPTTLPPGPAEIYDELFVAVQTEAVYPDSKTFVDAIPNRSPATILEAYRRERSAPSFDLRAFVAREFTTVVPHDTAYQTKSGDDVRAHIDRLWGVLTREPTPEPPYSTRLQLPRRYVVPGGRFNEIYYWDSYFTMLGLKASGEAQLIRDMCDNFAFLIDRYGHIPNGNRTYYLSRSQPPFFAPMVELLASIDGPQTYARYREALRKEHEFWMEGAARLRNGEAHRRVVRLADGALLNRHWDDRAEPRDESYREDVATARASGRDAQEMYRHLRAGAESGWDFSSRWLADRQSLGTIRATDLVPIDLNSLLYQLEVTLAHAHESVSKEDETKYRQAAAARQAAIYRHLWNEPSQAFGDFNWRTSTVTEQLSAATVTPLFFGLATDLQARAIARTMHERLLARHGLMATSVTTGQQWDAPNGWAPLQWMAIDGLNRYGETALAETIAQRWIEQNVAVFRKTGKLVEKYDVTSADAAGGGGEYPLQDGFGWTNGVLRALLDRYPQFAR